MSLLNILLSVPKAWQVVLPISPTITNYVSIENHCGSQSLALSIPPQIFTFSTTSWPAVHMPVPLFPKSPSWIWSRDGHIPKVIGATHKFKVTRDEMQFLLERCTYPHMNLPSDTLFYFPAPMTMNQLRKVGTWFLEREDNDPCRETYTLGSYHNIH